MKIEKAKDMEEILCLENIVTNIDNRQNLDHADLYVGKGEILAVTGLDDSGLTVLGDVISGIVNPVKGRILLEGVETAFSSENAAKEKGVFMIKSGTAVIPLMSMAENINVVRSSGDFFVNTKSNDAKTAMLIDHYGLDIRDVGYAGFLSMAHQVQVSILRALLCNAKLLVCSEVGNGYSTQELFITRQFFLKLKSEGISIILINSDISEMFDIADRIVVLRDGVICMNKERRRTSLSEINKRIKISGYKIDSEKEKDYPADFSIRIKHTTPHFNGFIDIDLSRGAATGLCWHKSHTGQTIYEVFTRKEKGEGVVIENKQIHEFNSWIKRHKYETYALGISFWEKNIFSNMTLAENLVFRIYKNYIGNVGGFNKKMIKVALREIVEREKIDRELLDVEARKLPISIQNRIVFWSLLLYPPKFLVLDNPIYGADVFIKNELFSVLDRLKESGTAILWSNGDNPTFKAYCERLIEMEI